MIGRLTDEEFKAMWYDRVSTDRIARQTGASREAVEARAAALRLPRRTFGAGNPPLTLEARIEDDVEFILYEIMQRRNYTSATRDKLQEAIERIARREIKAFCEPKKRRAA